MHALHLQWLSVQKAKEAGRNVVMNVKGGSQLNCRAPEGGPQRSLWCWPIGTRGARAASRHHHFSRRSQTLSVTDTCTAGSLSRGIDPLPHSG